MVVEIKADIINPLNRYFPKIEVIEDFDNVTNDGIYLLESNEEYSSQLMVKKGDNEIFLLDKNIIESNDDLDLLLLNLTEEINKL